MCTDLGPRYVPKNVGYALVVTGTADVFRDQARAQRADGQLRHPAARGRAVRHQHDHLPHQPRIHPERHARWPRVGSTPADPTFYAHVPSMRSQYGLGVSRELLPDRRGVTSSRSASSAWIAMERESFFTTSTRARSTSLPPVGTPHRRDRARGGRGHRRELRDQMFESEAAAGEHRGQVPGPRGARPARARRSSSGSTR